jgi:hypothetical protein
MPKDLQKNEILKEMWRLQEALDGGTPLNVDQTDYYNRNLKVIKSYYSENAMLWATKSQLPISKNRLRNKEERLK